MASPTLYFKQIQIGPMQNFAYLIGDATTHEALVVDAAWDIPAIVGIAEQDGYTINKALVTHYHQDHLGGDFQGHNIPGAAELLEKVKANERLRTELQKIKKEARERAGQATSLDS